MNNEIEEFFCGKCRAWLREGGTVHDDGEHEGAPPTRNYRYSADGGRTWRSEPGGPVIHVDISVEARPDA